MYGTKTLYASAFAICLGIVSAAGAALPQWTTKTTYQPAAPAPVVAAPRVTNKIDVATLILSTVPGNSVDQQRVYAPIAEKLSIALGRKVQFKPASNWLTYSREMTAGAYDLVLDDAHFNGWRSEHIQHIPLVGFGEKIAFALVAHSGDDKGPSIEKLSGRRVCTVAAPDLGALAVLAQFTNPARQPTVIESVDTNATYDAFADGKCTAAILPMSIVDKHQSELRVLYQTPVFPNATLSAGPRVDAQMRSAIVAALTAAAGASATQALRQYYGGVTLVPVQPQEYAGLSHWLKDSLYYQ